MQIYGRFRPCLIEIRCRFNAEGLLASAHYAPNERFFYQNDSLALNDNCPSHRNLPIFDNIDLCFFKPGMTGRCSI